MDFKEVNWSEDGENLSRPNLSGPRIFARLKTPFSPNWIGTEKAAASLINSGATFPEYYVSRGPIST
jgi:hypothetical protein